MRKFFVFTAPVLLVVVAFSPVKMVKTKVTDGITVSLPPNMFPMTPEDIAQRFPSVRAPLGAYTTEDRVVDFSVNVSATQWPDANPEIAQKFFKAALFNLYDKVDLIDEGIRESKKKKYIYFEFESRTNADRRPQGGSEPILKYTYIQYLVEPGRTLVFSFSCPRSLREEWQPVAHEIIKSVRVK